MRPRTLPAYGVKNTNGWCGFVSEFAKENLK